MNKWIDSASWKPVEGVLTSDDVYMSNMRRFEDPDDQWTRLLVFGSIGANNVRRAAEILQISTTLLPRVLHPTHHRAGARLPLDHHHRYAPVSVSHESTNQSGSFGCVGRGARQAPAVVLSLQHVTIRPLRARRAVAPQLPSKGLA
jgi:hypothetical protein